MIDFGMSKFSNGGKINLSTYCGTIEYMAPEVIQGQNYGSKCDIWSVGVMTYSMLCGVLPFVGKDEIDMSNKINSCNYKPHPVFREMEDAEDFIENLIKLS